MLENLEPAPPITATPKVKPSVEFDGYEGEAVTPGLTSEPDSFDDYLRDAGIDPTDIEVIPPVRTSRWQQQRDGELIWLTSYRFRFVKKSSPIDLPLLMAEAAKQKPIPKPKVKHDDKALVVLWSDLQVGKVDWRGGAAEALQRIEATQQRLLDIARQGNYSRCVFADLGDTVENFDNKASQHQRVSNDLSLMDQIDLATTYAWRVLADLATIIPQITYVSVGSNHCQWRLNGQAVGRPTDDWGVFIGRQLARLAQETKLPIRFYEPQAWDESLAIDVFDDTYHVLGVVHGHQARSPEALGDWWRKQAFGKQPVSEASILVHGHFHHLRIVEMGSTGNGASRFLIGAPTLDNGSSWYRLNVGDESLPGLAIFDLEKNKPFDGCVRKI